MSSFDFTFSDFTVFNNGINTVNLQCEVEEVINKSFYISLRGNKFTFFFDVALTGPEQTSLTTIVNNHNGSDVVDDACIPEETIVNANLTGNVLISGGTESVGNVVGSGTSTDNSIVRWDGVNGNLIQNSVVTIDDSGVILGVSIDADNNTLNNIDNLDIKAGAEIDATKIHDGSVNNTEFGYLNGVTSPLQNQIDTKVEETRIINTGNVLVGGGDLTSDRTIELDILGLNEDVSPDGANDFILTFDDSASEYKKVLIDNLPSSGSGEVNTASNVGLGGVGVFKQKTGVNLEFKNINNTDGISVINDGANDEIDIGLDINSLVEDTNPVSSADFVAIFDSSAADHKKVLLSNLPTLNNQIVAFDVYDNAGGQTTTSSTGTVVNLDTVRKNTGEFSLSSDVITINSEGTYFIVYRVSTDISTGTDRSASSCWLELNTGSGFSEIDGSRAFMYNREVIEGDNTGTGHCILDLVSGNSIRLLFSRIDGNSTIRTIADGSGVSILKISGGIKGDQGPAGDNEIIIENTGIVVSGSPFETLNFIGASSILQNGVDPSQVDITLPTPSSSLTSNLLTRTISASTTSSTFSVIPTLTFTSPASGTYIVCFTGSGECNTDATTGFTAIFVGGVEQTSTISQLGSDITGFAVLGFIQGSMVSQSIVNVNGSQNIDVRFRVTGGTLTIQNCTFYIVKIG